MEPSGPETCHASAFLPTEEAHQGSPHPVSPHLPLDVLQEVLMALQEAEVLELGVIPLRLDKTPLLDVHHLPEAICSERVQMKG